MAQSLKDIKRCIDTYTNYEELEDNIYFTFKIMAKFYEEDFIIEKLEVGYIKYSIIDTYNIKHVFIVENKRLQRLNKLKNLYYEYNN